MRKEKATMKQRKSASRLFDIPKLKFGPSKETQAIKQHLSARQSFDSEPPTPVSVRPPLEPLAEAQLKAACAWVIANYRPSHIPYGNAADTAEHVEAVRQDVDRAAIEAEVRREMEVGTKETVQWPSIQEDVMRVDPRRLQWPSSDMFRHKATESSKDWLQSHDLEAMREQRNSIIERADQLMANLEETQKMLLTPEMRSHKRHASNESSKSLPADGNARALKIVPRSDSAGTATSTPPTDVTDSVWVNSTAPTTAYVTPATQSKRTSHAQSDTHLPPRVNAVDAEWMRQELEKHVRAQEEEAIKQWAPVQSPPTTVAETTPAQTALSPATPQQTQRKQGLRRYTGESQQNFSVPTGSRRSNHNSRPASRYGAVAAEFEEMPVLQRPHAGSTSSANDQSQHTRGRSITRDLKSFVRPTTAQTAFHAENETDPRRTRSRSNTNLPQNFSRPELKATSRKASVEISPPQSRAGSVDSFRSAISALSSSVESSAARPWRSWRQRRGSQHSERSEDLYHPGIHEPERGRSRVPYHSPAPPSRPKPNLNRQLPPLPGLDLWQPEDEVSPVRQHETVETEEHHSSPLNARMQQSFPQRQGSLQYRKPTGAARHQPSASSPTHPAFQRHSVYLDAPTSPYREEPLAPTNTLDPSSSRAAYIPEPRDRRQRNRPAIEPTSRDFTTASIRTPTGKLSLEQRPPLHQLNSATSNTATAEKRHSRIFYSPATAATDAAPNFSRKISSDHKRLHHSQYQNMLEVTPSRSNGSGNGPRAVPPEDGGKGRKHWWSGSARKGGKSKGKREETWMDAVVKSGSTSGVLLPGEGPEGAGAPVVRY